MTVNQWSQSHTRPPTRSMPSRPAATEPKTTARPRPGGGLVVEVFLPRAVTPPGP